MGTGERLFVGLLGLTLLGLGGYVLLVAGLLLSWRLLGGLVMAALGANAVYGAVTGRRPWLAKVGPLP